MIHPSDPYTFAATDLEVAALVVFSISTLYREKDKVGNIDDTLKEYPKAVKFYCFPARKEVGVVG